MAPYMKHKYDLRKKLINATAMKKKTGWFDIPYEMRTIVIEYMDTKTKGRFSCCSKLCYEEIMMSNDYIEKIEFTDDSVTGGRIKCDFHDESYNFELDFWDDCEDTLSIRNECATHTHEWFLEKPCNMQKIGNCYFKRMISNAMNLKTFIFDPETNFNTFDITHLKKLETLRVFQRARIQVDLVKCGFVLPEMLFKMKTLIQICASLNLEQLIKLSARKIRLFEMKISSESLNIYLKLVHFGELNENIKKLKLDMHENHFLNPKKVVECLNTVNKHEIKNDIIWFEMKIQTRPDRYAMVRIEPSSFLIIIRLEEKRAQYMESECQEEIYGYDEEDDVMSGEFYLKKQTWLAEEEDEDYSDEF